MSLKPFLGLDDRSIAPRGVLFVEILALEEGVKILCGFIERDNAGRCCEGVVLEVIKLRSGDVWR